MSITSKEKVTAALNRNNRGCVPAAITPWRSTLNKWIDQGYLQDGDFWEHFNLDLRRGGACVNSVANLDFEPEILEETEDTKLVLDGNGAKLRLHKAHESTPEHVDFLVRDRQSWQQHAKPFLTRFDGRRIDFAGYEEGRRIAADNDRFFYHASMAPFEQMHRLSGHEYLLMGMALDPDWVKDMVMTFAQMTVTHLEELFGRCGRPDGMFYFEDMGFKEKPFMSPSMYNEIMLPGHKLLFDFAHSIGCKVMVHSCGYVEPLVPGLIEAGMDCLQAMEVKAGMDLPRLFDKFGDRIAFFGGFDVRTLISNDKEQIDKEFEKVEYVLKNGGGYILHSDHSEPPEIEYETIVYFLEKSAKYKF
jgi:uroporphyrinogen decarboxylase